MANSMSVPLIMQGQLASKNPRQTSVRKKTTPMATSLLHPFYALVKLSLKSRNVQLRICLLVLCSAEEQSAVIAALTTCAEQQPQ